MAEFNWKIRVYYEDTDAAGVVYHANYLCYMERARTEWLRDLGYTHQRLNETENLVFVVSSMTIEFKKPAYFDELLNINCRLAKLGGTSMIFEQTICNDEAETKCRADVHIACVDASTFKPRRIPAALRAEFGYDN
jgi:acyl-CoA thioester hydrolase